MLSEKDRELLIKIRKHLHDLHKAWVADGGGHHKSNEGWVGFSVSYPNWFEADSPIDYLDANPEVYAVQVYSYLFGPHRLHEFDDLLDAWMEVQTWGYGGETN